MHFHAGRTYPENGRESLPPAQAWRAGLGNRAVKKEVSPDKGLPPAPFYFFAVGLGSPVVPPYGTGGHGSALHLPEEFISSG